MGRSLFVPVKVLMSLGSCFGIKPLGGVRMVRFLITPWCRSEGKVRHVSGFPHGGCLVTLCAWQLAYALVDSPSSLVNSPSSLFAMTRYLINEG